MSNGKQLCVFSVNDKVFFGQLDFQNRQKLQETGRIVCFKEVLMLAVNPNVKGQVGFIGTTFGVSAIPNFYCAPSWSYFATADEIIEYQKAIEQFEERSRQKRSGIVIPSLNTKDLKV